MCVCACVWVCVGVGVGVCGCGYGCGCGCGYRCVCTCLWVRVRVCFAALCLLFCICHAQLLKLSVCLPAYFSACHSSLLTLYAHSHYTLTDISSTTRGPSKLALSMVGSLNTRFQVGCSQGSDPRLSRVYKGRAVLVHTCRGVFRVRVTVLEYIVL